MCIGTLRGQIMLESLELELLTVVHTTELYVLYVVSHTIWVLCYIYQSLGLLQEEYLPLTSESSLFTPIDHRLYYFLRFFLRQLCACFKR